MAYILGVIPKQKLSVSAQGWNLNKFRSWGFFGWIRMHFKKIVWFLRNILKRASSLYFTIP